MRGFARRVAKWGPVAAIIAVVAREASHIHLHFAAPHTIAVCVAVPVLAGCACIWHRHHRKNGGDQ